MTKALTREAFLKPAEVPTERVELPELDAFVTVRGMTANERNKFDKQFQTKTGKTNRATMDEIRQRLVVWACVDESGAPLFTQEDVASIGAQSAAVVERIVNVAQRLCGMSDTDIEGMAKNSGETPDAG